MGFPESFELGNTKNPNRRYYQLGNAVCPPVIHAIGARMLRAMGIPVQQQQQQLSGSKVAAQGQSAASSAASSTTVSSTVSSAAALPAPSLASSSASASAQRVHAKARQMGELDRAREEVG